MSFNVYIPARYAANRLSGKLLLKLHGRPVLEHVYERALASGAERVVVATDDERIAQEAMRFGAHVCMTSSTHCSGTDRIAEAATQCGEADDAVIVNVQGDEPQIPSAVIAQVAALLYDDATLDMATVCEPIVAEADFCNPNIVKVVTDQFGRALLFSRAPVPHARDGRDFSQRHDAWPQRHVGIYAYRYAYLRRFVMLPTTHLEQLESLEQLRALGHGARIGVAGATLPCGIGIDTLDDLVRARAARPSA